MSNLLLKIILSLVSYKKISDIAFSITVLKPSFCLISFADTLQDSEISFIFCHLSACLSYNHQVKTFDESLQMTDESLQKIVSVHKSQHTHQYIGSFQYGFKALA